ncbi:MAG: FprA family A-type flavoprotein [Thermodesulfobacteriota bacterium]
MPVVEIKPEVFWIGVNDRTTDLFEGFWPITSEGISYNAYLINDQKKALIDLTKSFKANEFFKQIDEMTNISGLDYIIINHMEPDHSGVLNTLRRITPHASILGSQKTKEMLESFYGITENVRVVQDGETLSLGKRTLKFISTPMVHWPETMMTYETSHGILFSCDGFGGYGALRGAIFDDECTDIEFYQREALRYYTNVVARFSSFVLKAVDKLADISIKVVAPSHGLIWRKDPTRIVNLYRKWAEYATGKTEGSVTLVYGSMYGNTELMMNAVTQGISRTGVPVEIFDAARTHASYILPSLWSKTGVMIGAPTSGVALFYPLAHLLDIAVHKGLRNKKVAFFGSYGWVGGARKGLEKIIEPAQWYLVDSLEFVGGPTKEDLKRGEEFGTKFVEIIKNA